MIDTESVCVCGLCGCISACPMLWIKAEVTIHELPVAKARNISRKKKVCAKEALSDCMSGNRRAPLHLSVNRPNATLHRQVTDIRGVLLYDACVTQEII